MRPRLSVEFKNLGLTLKDGNVILQGETARDSTALSQAWLTMLVLRAIAGLTLLLHSPQA